MPPPPPPAPTPGPPGITANKVVSAPGHGVPPGVNREELSRRLWRRWEQASQARMPWHALWRELAELVRPSADALDGAAYQGAPKAPNHRLFDSVGIRSNNVLAAGCVSWLTPAQTPWFAYEPPRGLRRSDAARSWCAEVTEITMEVLAGTNFYEAIHENFLDRSGFGTDCLLLDESERTGLRFEAPEHGSYAVLEGADGTIDTVFREYEWDTRQAMQRFGGDAPRRVRECHEAGKHDQKHRFLYVVYPREDFEKDARSPRLARHNLPWASVYLSMDTREVCHVGGHHEPRAIVSRFLKWGSRVYGLPPGLLALPDLRQVNELVRNMDVLAEVSASPRILAPAEHEGEFDLMANGITFLKDPSRAPREWLTGGRYDIGLDRENKKREAVEWAFHVPLFNMWGSLDKRMTAREVAAREGEKLNLFSPTFSRWVSEKGNPLLRSVFSMLVRRGEYPDPPEEMFVAGDGSPGSPGGLALPKVSYVSRLALSLRQVHRAAFAGVLEYLGPLAQAKPEVFDNFDVDGIARGLARGDNLPEEWLVDSGEVERLREERAAAQMQAAQAAQAPMGAPGPEMLPGEL